MSSWWYAENDNKNGPVEIDHLKRLLITGKISTKTIVWREGMESWLPLYQVEELNELKAVVPPPLPRKADIDPLNYPMATKWPRFFARIFDVWWEVLLIATIAELILGRYSASYVQWSTGVGANQIFAILCLPFGLLLDATVYRLFGNTPGKALIGIKVATIDGKPLNFTKYLSRNLELWASGLALGVPLINLFTMASQSGRLDKNQQASYDQNTGYRVRSKPSGWVRKTAFSLAFICLFSIMAVLNAAGQADQKDIVTRTAQKDFTWENPITLKTASIESIWKPTVQPAGEGKQAYMFQEVTDHAVIVFAAESASGFTLDDYQKSFQKNNVKVMNFADGGKFFQKLNRQAWKVSGTMVDDPNARFTIEIIQEGSAFWRVITIQTMPYEYSYISTATLKSQLWGTAFN